MLHSVCKCYTREECDESISAKGRMDTGLGDIVPQSRNILKLSWVRQGRLPDCQGGC